MIKQTSQNRPIFITPIDNPTIMCYYIPVISNTTYKSYTIVERMENLWKTLRKC